MDVVIACSKAQVLGQRIAKQFGAELVEYETRKFSDGEVYARVLGNVNNKEVLIVQAGYPEPNDAIIELFLVIDACRSLNSRRIRVVMPYFPYARQDKRFNRGESLSLHVIAELLKSMGVSLVVTADAHFKEEYGPYDFFGIKAYNISGGTVLAEHIKEKFKLKDFVVVSPDLGSRGMIAEAAKNVGADTMKINKKRKSETEVEMTAKDLDVKGKDVLIIDDIISTGGTMLKAIELMKKAGANRVFAGATHGIFSKDSFKKLEKATTCLVTTDSIQTGVMEVTLAGEIMKVIEDSKVYF
jgi:ribose-phosphate pyrophosphokinase